MKDNICKINILLNNLVYNMKLLNICLLLLICIPLNNLIEWRNIKAKNDSIINGFEMKTGELFIFKSLLKELESLI